MEYTEESEIRRVSPSAGKHTFNSGRYVCLLSIDEATSRPTVHTAMDSLYPIESVTITVGQPYIHHLSGMTFLVVCQQGDAYHVIVQIKEKPVERIPFEVAI